MSSIKVYKPTSAGRRKSSVVNYSEVLTTDKPYKKLILSKKNSAGRNNRGTITVRHRGGGSRNKVRIVNFKRNFNTGFKVLTVEYDPGRSAFISLALDLETGKKHYVLHTKGMEVGKTYGDSQEIIDGNDLPLKSIPVGSFVSQIEINPGQGAKIVRSAGTYGIVTARDEKYVTVKLPSGEVRKFNIECKAVLSRVGNDAHGLVRWGKAGRIRHKGRRPVVRGKVMNPVDHPHGGGEGRNPIGLKYPKTPWGKHALGVKTRDAKKASSRFIVSRRKKKK